MPRPDPPGASPSADGRALPRLAVGAIAVDGGRVHLVRRDEGWTPPVGLLEIGEAAQEGARRVTEDATGMRVEMGRLIGAYSRPAEGLVTLIFDASVVGRDEPRPVAGEVRAFAPEEIPWADLATTTAESGLRDWLAAVPGHGPRHEPELYVEGDPE